MARPDKVASVEEIRTKLGSANAAVLTEYRGLKVSELATLRASLRSADAEYKVFKNTLARRAVEEEGLPDLVALLTGPTAITFVRGDAVAVAKALRDFAKTTPALVVKGGVLGARIMGPADVSALADIEPREVLLAKIAGCFQAPLVKAAGLFQALPRNMAYGIKALIDQRVAGGEAAPPTAEPEVAEAPSAAAEPDVAEVSAGAAPDEAPASDAPVAEAPAPEAPVEAAAPEATEEASAEATAPEAAGEAPAEVPAPEAVEEAPTAAAVDGPPPEAEAETPPAAEAEAAPAGDDPTPSEESASE